jgi:hypothetical protein
MNGFSECEQPDSRRIYVSRLYSWTCQSGVGVSQTCARVVISGIRDEVVLSANQTGRFYSCILRYRTNNIGARMTGREVERPKLAKASQASRLRID